MTNATVIESSILIPIVLLTGGKPVSSVGYEVSSLWYGQITICPTKELTPLTYRIGMSTNKRGKVNKILGCVGMCRLVDRFPVSSDCVG